MLINDGVNGLTPILGRIPWKSRVFRWLFCFARALIVLWRLWGFCEDSFHGNMINRRHFWVEFSNIAYCRSLCAKRPIILSHIMENCFGIPPSLVYVARSKSVFTNSTSLMWFSKYRAWRISVTLDSSCAVLTSNIDDEANQFVSIKKNLLIRRHSLTKMCSSKLIWRLSLEFWSNSFDFAPVLTGEVW